MSQPPITIITRTFGGRPRMFRRLLESLAAQTLLDYEHRVLWLERETDSYKASNGALARLEASGRYVYILDDDDRLEDPMFIETVASFSPYEHPWLMVKAHLGSPGERSNGIFPCPWGEDWRPVFSCVSSLNLVVSQAVWNRCRGAFAGDRGGDFRLACELWEKGYRPTWVDIVAARTQMIGDGRAEADLSRDDLAVA